MSDHKKDAVAFLQMVVAGEIEQAYRKYVDMSGKHHNPYNAAGFPALQKGMLENDKQFPRKQITVKHVLGDGDMVSVHSHVVLKSGEMELATNHILRFAEDQIVEMWDCAQVMPKDSLNKDGMF
jgi:predicted SnoaL-like aldol condensation-catalyzing enzyme